MTEKGAAGGAAGRRRSGRQTTSPEVQDGDDATPSGAGPRRSGRQNNTPAAAPVPNAEKSDPAPKTAPAKGRGRTSTPAAATVGRPTSKKTATTGGKGQTKSRLGQESETARSSGARALRRRASVSFREASDDEAEGTSNNVDSDIETTAPIDEIIDDTVYEVPADAVVPPASLLPLGVDGNAGQISVPSSAAGDLAAAYALLRSFSWQLRLSPFPFEDFCAAMCATHPSLLVDEVHVCVLRALGIDEVPEERAERKLDLGLLDTMTWPCYVWEWLRLTEDPLAKHEWAQRAGGPPRNDQPAEPAAVSTPAAPAAVQPPIEPSSDKVEVKDGDPSEIVAMEVDAAAPAMPAVVPSPAVAPPTAPAAPPRPRPKAFEPVDIDHMDSQLAAAAVAPPEVSAADLFSDRTPTPPTAQGEYYALPVEVKAAILSRLCDHLLDCTTIRAEIDRREGGGLFVSGRGGVGGAFAIMTPEEKKRAAARAARKQLSDANTDTCVLCGVGGSLLCCDGCPSAYHMRCLGETLKTLGEGEWMCPECAVGGRGETAGLRMPVAARNKWKQPLHLLNGLVIRTELPAVKSRGRHTEELTIHPPAVVLRGEAAETAIAESHKVKAADEIPLASSFETVQKPAQWPAGEGGASGPESYSNKYKNGWTATVISLRATLEDAKKRKHKGGLAIPTGTTGRLSVPEFPEPMPLSRFQWVQMQGRPMGRSTVRCGKCHTCQRPTLRKGCLNPISKAPEDPAAAAVANQQPDTSKLGYLIAYVSKVEREFWALAEGPWASEPGGGMQYRARWAATVRSTNGAADLAQSILQLESVLRPIAFSSSWFGEDKADGATGAGGGNTSHPGSRAMSRAPSMGDILQSGGGGGASGSQAAIENEGEDGDAGGSQARGQTSADPYDIRFEKLVMGGWEMDRRSHAAHAARVNRLPRSLLKKAARHAGRKPISGIRYRKQAWTLSSPRLAWIAEMEAVETCAQLSMAIRKLDAVLNWEPVAKPKGLSSDAPYANATVQGKRAAADGTGYEYFIETKVSQAVEAAAAAQQQLQAALQQRFAMGHAMLLQAQAQQAHQAQQANGASGSMPTNGPTPGRLGTLGQWPTPNLAVGSGIVGMGAPVLQPQQPQKLELAPGSGAGPPPLPAGPVAASEPFTVKPEGNGVQQPVVSPVEGLLGSQQAALAAPSAVESISAVAAAPPVPAAAPSIVTTQQASVPTYAPALPPGFPQNAIPPQMFHPFGFMPSHAVPAMPSPDGVAPTANAPAASQPAEQKPALKPTERLSDEEKLVRELVEIAIKRAIEREEEERMLNMPAAMAAKMRSRQLAGGNSTEDLKKSGSTAKEASQDAAPASAAGPSSAPAAAVAAASGHPPLHPGLAGMQGVPPGLMPFMGLMQARQHILTPPPPSWVHERDIPLWFIRSYEELCRREAANQAARELQAAARRGSITQDSTVKEAARKAAHAAAQAAADACGICSTAQGDNAELDALWICCDTCNRWFHGACVAMTQEDVDAVAEDEQWDCPGCANARRKAERAARREGKTVPPGFSPFETDANKRSGRPPKPFYERADYKAGEARMLEKLKRGETTEGRNKKQKSGAAEIDEETAARRAERLERLKRKREEEAKAAAEPPPPVNCPVCQYPDYGRPLVSCDGCRRWFHYECTGTAVEDVETAVAEKLELKCAECQGKRVRPPTQAAIDAAILAAADRGDGGGGGARKRARLSSGGGGGSGLSAAVATAGVNTASAGRKVHSEATWRDAAVKVLAKTMKMAIADPFNEPVSLDEVPDYTDVVANPMDLSTLRQGLPRLSSPMDVIAGVNLIVDNCIAYNGEGSEYAGAAVEMQRGFLKHWVAEGLPMTGERWERMLSEAARRERERAAGTSSGRGGGRGRGGGGGGGRGRIATSLAALTPPPGAVPAPDWPTRASKALIQVSRLRAAEHFTEPVPRGFMNYHDVIQRPMDLGTIAKRLARGQYADPREMAADVAQVWANCRIFNEPDAPVVADAATAETAFIKYWTAAGVYQGSSASGSGGEREISAPGISNRSGRGARAGGITSSGFKGGDWREAARTVLYRMINFVAQAAWFAAPVSEKEAPDYRDIVPHPMDLGTALEKLKTGLYASPAELLVDVDLIWSNAELYNGPDHPVTKAARKAQAVFQKHWDNAGLGAVIAPGGIVDQAAAAAPAPGNVAGAMAGTSAQHAQHHLQQQGGRGAGAPLADWIPRVRAVLGRVMQHPSAEIFSEPITETEAPGYSKVVSQPMDLGTILKNLGRGRYSGPEQVMEDVQLIFANCRAYSDPEDEFYEMGQEVERVVVEAWRGAGLPGV